MIAKIKKSALKKIKQLKFKTREYLIFKSRNDKKLLYNLAYGKIEGKSEVELNIKSAGEAPFICRNNNSDYAVIRSTFLGLYHLPPRKLKSGAVILDLGANIGSTMRHFKYIYPNSKIIGVEMDYENYLLAKKNLTGFDNCTLINAAIWYKDGVVNYTGNDSHSYHCTDVSSVSNERVKSFSLITLFKENNLTGIDYVKMDIEGAEAHIFNADCEWLNFVKSINIEVHNGEPLTKYTSVLKKYGFHSKTSLRHWSAVLAYK